MACPSWREGGLGLRWRPAGNMHQACNASRKDVKKLHSAGAGDIPGWPFHVNKAARIPFRHDAPYLSRTTARRPEPKSSSALVRRSCGKRNSVAVRPQKLTPYQRVHLCGTEGRVEIRIPVNPGARRADPVQGRWLIAGRALCAARSICPTAWKPRSMACSRSMRCSARRQAENAEV